MDNTVAGSSTRKHRGSRKWLDPDNDVDCGWAWLVLASDFVVALLTAMPYSGGIFNLIFLDVYGRSKQTTGWLLAVHMSMLHLTGPVSSYLNDRLGPRWTLVLGGMIGAVGYALTCFTTSFTFVFITYGVIAGFGLGIAYSPCIAVISIYFKKHRNIAFGVIMTGMGVGTMVLPILIMFCENLYGWRGCMLILSGLQLQLIVCGALSKSRKLPEITDVYVSPKTVTDSENKNEFETCEENGDAKTVHGFVEQNQDSTTETSFSVEISDKFDALKTPTRIDKNRKESEKYIGSKEEYDYSYVNYPKLYHNIGLILFTASIFCGFVSSMLTYVHFPAYFVMQGSTKATVSSQLTIIGICNISSRILATIATNDQTINPMLLFITSCGISSILTLLCPLISPTLAGQTIFAIVFGLYSPWFFSTMPLITIEMVGAERLSMAWGMENVAGGVGALVGPPLAGMLYDVSGDYAYSMYVAGIFYAVACVLGLCIPVVNHGRSHRMRTIHK